MAKLTWYGHSCFAFQTDDGVRILFDPFLDENPASPISSDDVGDFDYILVSHGHYDHLDDCISVAQRTKALVVTTVELAKFLGSKGLERTHGMNVGGAHDFDFGRLKLTIAHHTGGVSGDESGRFTTTPCGFLLQPRSGARLYFAGDTGLTLDMRLLEGEVDVALLPIGDNFTMGPDDAARAVEFIRPRIVVPMHYDTWDLIRQDPAEFARKVGDLAEVRVLAPGQSTEI